MMKIKYIKPTLLALFFLSTFLLQGQEKKITQSLDNGMLEKNAAKKSIPMTATLFKEIIHTESANKWAISVRPTFSRRHFSQDSIQIKETQIQEKTNTFFEGDEMSKSLNTVNITIGTNFEANWTQVGNPPDNSMAISNGGFIVTANNDGLEYYNSSGSFLYFDFWSDFFNDNTLASTIFDPRVIYDSGSDRFVLVVLHGYTGTSSKVLVCFSKTNNPQDGWWAYKLTGNPLSNNCWFDYPSIGVSNNEIYVTGNLFSTFNFNQSVIYQISKAEGYTGENLNWQYWSDLSSSPFTAISLVPASYGHQGNYGPGIYFVSNNTSFDNRVRLWDLTDDMSGNPSLNSYTINTRPYNMSSNAPQRGTNDRLSIEGCRIQNAFYLNGIVHFVFQSNIGFGRSGVVYNRLDVSDYTIQTSTFGHHNGYYGGNYYAYPAVVPFSTNKSDKSVMITYLNSSLTVYPEIRVVHCDDNFQWSSSTLIKKGETYVNLLTGIELWGDYTGISRKHNSETPRIWVAGSYGANIPSLNINNTFKTWIAEVYEPSADSLNDISTPPANSLFPNPTYDLINIYFTSEGIEKTTIQIFDMNGKVVKILYSDVPKAGENKLTFNKGALAAGTYYVNIATSSNILRNEKLIILD